MLRPLFCFFRKIFCTHLYILHKYVPLIDFSRFLMVGTFLYNNFCFKIYFLPFSATKSKVTIGIAGPDIKEDAHPGNWNNTVGYHSDTGKCFTSHKEIANTNGEKFGIGMLCHNLSFFCLLVAIIL